MPSIYQITPAFQNLLRPLVQRMFNNGTTANQITLIAGIGSVLVKGETDLFILVYLTRVQ